MSTGAKSANASIDPPSPNYIESAVAAECAKVVDAPPHTANDTLHRASVAVGTMVGAGWVDGSAAVASLEQAAAQRCDDTSEALATIKSGLDWGLKHPRSAALHGRSSRGIAAKSPSRLSERNTEENRVRAERQWAASSPIANSMAESYLAERGIVGPLPFSLRFAAEVAMPDGGKHPAMIAAVTVPTTGDLIAIQRTALKKDGYGKANIPKPKAALGSTSGGAVVFGHLMSGEAILEGEGIETVLSACQATKLPGIATLSAGTLGKPDIPIGRAVIILADIGSEVAAEAGASRRVQEGRSVRIAIPPCGKDFNDTLLAVGADVVNDCVIKAAPFRLPDIAKSYVVRRLADIHPERINWLWNQQIAKGKLSLIAGHPGRGKSQLTLAIAALVSTGGVWPDGATCAQGTVVLVSCEDDQADTVVPRLIALEHVHLRLNQ